MNESLEGKTLAQKLRKVHTHTHAHAHGRIHKYYVTHMHAPGLAGRQC